MSSPSTETPILYWPRYCEENVWHLAGSPELEGAPLEVVFISNRTRTVAMWAQNAHAGGPTVWDYHVILLRGGPRECLVWDLDSRLGCPVPARTYFARSFGQAAVLPEHFQPRFRVISGPEYRAHFASDRSHMQHDGGWHAPPPPWPAIPGPKPDKTPTNLMRFVDVEQDFLGRTFDLEGLRRQIEA